MSQISQQAQSLQRKLERTRRVRRAPQGGALAKLAVWLPSGCLAVALLPLAAVAADAQRVLVVAGLGGEPAYEDAFQTYAKAAADSATAAGATVTLLTGEDATGAAIQQALADIAAVAVSEEAVVAHFIGHGSYDGEHYRFNVPGPDPTGEQLAAWLAPLPQRRLVILATSAGGAALPLFADSVAVVSATRDGREVNAVAFPRFWSAALTDSSADTDKDGRVSAAEAFHYAESAVAAHYEGEGRIATEHPLLTGAAADFVLAKAAGAVKKPQVDAATADLLERSETLTRRINDLKAKRRDYEMDEYFALLQELLLELALVERELGAGRTEGAEEGAEDEAPR